jgi:hypothetical protein
MHEFIAVYVYMVAPYAQTMHAHQFPELTNGFDFFHNKKRCVHGFSVS